MRLVHYLLTFFFGLIGTLALARSIERLLTGQGLILVQLFFAAGGLALAVKYLRKARAAAAAPKGSTQ